MTSDKAFLMSLRKPFSLTVFARWVTTANSKNWHWIWTNHDDDANGGCISSAGPIATPHPPPVIILWPMGGYWTVGSPAADSIHPQSSPAAMRSGLRIRPFNGRIIGWMWVCIAFVLSFNSFFFNLASNLLSLGGVRLVALYAMKDTLDGPEANMDHGQNGHDPGPFRPHSTPYHHR